MNTELQHIKQRFHIIGNASLLNRAIEIAIQVAPTDLSVLIIGESGTGKESFSKIIHALSPYRHGNFTALNCGAIPEGTIDSELFGHEKGSFTGAWESRKGYFEASNGGTIFLDEIGEMPLATQTKLLRVLEYGEYVRVGSSKVEKTKVRVVAATHVYLLQAIREGKFREDLYYRLNTVPIAIPPLREREEDILLLFHKFASDFASKYLVRPLELTSEARDLFLKYPFPGNIRQLKNIVEQIALLEEVVMVTPELLEKYLPKEDTHILPVLYKQWSGNGMLEKEFLYAMLFDLKREVAELKDLLVNWRNTLPHAGARLFTKPFDQEPLSRALHFLDADQPAASSMPTIERSAPIITRSTSTMTENLSIEAQEQALIRKSLQKNHGNRRNTADDLGISERTLYRKIKQYEIEERNTKP